MASIIVMKGGSADAEKNYDLDVNKNLDEIRDILTADGFITADDDNGPQYRFIAGKAKKLGKDLVNVIIPDSLESAFPLHNALRGERGLIVTDINAAKKPDLMGIGTDWFFNRYLGVQIFINNTDASAKQQNDAIGVNSLVREQLMMMTNVHSTSQRVIGTYDNVCVVVDGSVVGFRINSWGAAGFQYNIAPGQGPAISDDLCVCIGPNPNGYATSELRRYQNPHDNPQTIQIVGADSQTVPIGTNPVQFQRVTFRSRRISAYTQDGQDYRSDQKGPAPKPSPMMKAAAALDSDDAATRGLANATTTGVVGAPGDSIKPGGPTGGGASNQPIGTISNLETDDWTEALGEVVVFFFVFKTLDDAKRVIDQYNAPNPDLWK